MQRSVLSLAFDVLESSIAPRTTVQAPVRWGSDEWRDNFMKVSDENRAALLAAGDARRAKQSRNKS